MTEYLWGRKCKILIAKKSGEAIDVSTLRCLFKVTKIGLSPVNFAEVTAHNLSVQTENMVIEESDRLIIEAGYSGYLEEQEKGSAKQVKSDARYGKIFDGEIVQAIRDKDENNVDYRLMIIAIDGDQGLNLNFVKMTANKGINQRDIVNYAAGQAKVPLEVGHISPDIGDKVLPRGKVFFGEPKKYFRQVAQDNNGTYWVEDGQLVVAKLTDIPPGEALVLTPKNGLIGTPQQTIDGVYFKCLLDPRIRLRTMVKIDNSYIRQMKLEASQIMTVKGNTPQVSFLPVILDQDGQYQVQNVTHHGDTRGNDWYSEIAGVSRNGKGLVSMLAYAGQNPF